MHYSWETDEKISQIEMNLNNVFLKIFLSPLLLRRCSVDSNVGAARRKGTLNNPLWAKTQSLQKERNEVAKCFPEHALARFVLHFLQGTASVTRNREETRAQEGRLVQGQMTPSKHRSNPSVLQRAVLERLITVLGALGCGRWGQGRNLLSSSYLGQG